MQYTTEQLEAMRDWLKDCTFRDIEPEEIDELTDNEIIKGVQTHYDGGLIEFTKTLELC